MLEPMNEAELLRQLRDPCPHENCLLCYQAADTLEDYGKSIQKLREERAALDAEVRIYRSMFDGVRKDLMDWQVMEAITHYDGDGSKPCCDLVYCGLKIIQKYLKERSELDERRKSNPPACA